MVEVTAETAFFPLFYIIIISAIVIIALIIFFIGKLKYNSKQIWKSIWVSLLITIGIHLLMLIISFFLPQPMCKQGYWDCSNNAELLLGISPYTIPLIFLIVILIYYIIKVIKKRYYLN